MNLKNFHKQIDPSLLNRGRNYFEDSNVKDLIEEEPDYWSATVLGSEEYFVDIELKNSTIKAYSCDCPHDADICKHIVAVLFSICEQKNISFDGENKTSSKKPAKMNFRGLLGKVSEAELREFILYYGKQSKIFKDDFELYFAYKDENFNLEKQLTEQIKKLIKKYSKWDYIDHSSSNQLGRELQKLLKQGQGYLAKNNLFDTYIFSKTFISQTIPVISYSDDSHAYISDAILMGLELLMDLAYQAPLPLKENIIEFLDKQLQDPIYFEFGDYGYMLVDLYGDLCDDLNKLDEFILLIDRLINRAINDQNIYLYENLICKKIILLREAARDDQADLIVKNNLHFKGVKKIRVFDLIEEREFQKAEELVKQAISKAQKDKLIGLVKEWEVLLLHIYELNRDSNTAREFLEKFAFDSPFNEEYYHRWKKSFTEQEWPAILEKKIDEIQEVTMQDKQIIKWYNPEYALLMRLGPLFVEEQMFDRLIQLIKKQSNLDIILQYHKYLYNLYPQELYDLYDPLLDNYAESTDERREYRLLLEVVGMIYKTIPQSREKIIDKLNNWLITYKRRPAMLDEINNFLSTAR